MRDYDVIVIGSGGAGLSAAINASEGGARVLLAEAADRLGGSTALSGGVFYAADTSLQRECGIVGDTADAMFHYLMGINQWRAEPDMIRTLSENSTPMFEYLRGLGVNFAPERLYHACVSGTRRGHQAAEFGFEIARALENKMGSLENIDVAKKTRVRRLLHDANGGVSGIHVDGEDVRSGAVVIASGGFGHNKALLQRYYPTAAQHGWPTVFSENTDSLSASARRRAASQQGHRA